MASRMTAKIRKAPRGGKRSGKTEFALSVCAATKDGMPDMYNAVPKRAVSQDEAKSHGWPHFYDGVTQCPQGHVAGRYMSNTYRCIDCARIADGKLPIYGTDPNADLIGEAVVGPDYTDPALNTSFRWTEENFRQFGVAYVNTGSVEAALKLLKAQPFDLITELRANPERAQLFESLRTDVDQVFLWKAEGSAATGSDRAMLARAGASFPERFGSRAQAGLDTQPYVNPDKAVAELAQLLRSAQEALTQQDALGAARPSRRAVENLDAAAAADAAGDVEEDVLLGPPLDNSDLV